LTARNKKLLSYLLKLGILVLAFWFINQRIAKYNDSLHKFFGLVSRISSTRVVVTLSAIVILMLANWVLEALKWRYLARSLAKMTVWQSIESVFCGLTWAIFTPNRFGEYGGRVMYLPNRRRVHGVFAMAVGSFGQNAVTNVLGAVGITWFVLTWLHWPVWLQAGTVLFNAGFIVVMLLAYFNIKWLVWLLNKVKFLKKFHRFFDIMGRYKFDELLHIMWYCLARFFVFTFQYFLIIHLLIPQMGVLSMMLTMFVFFFIQSAMPSQDIIDFGVRSVTADMLFGYFTNQHIAIIVSVSLIYIVNIIIPAILGSVFVLNVKFFDRTA
jgi:MFS family permease